MPQRLRLLGFAFANADFLFEVDGAGKIVFAAGATGDLIPAGAEALTGQTVGRLFQPSEASKFANYASNLGKGDRAGPFPLKLVGGTEANVSMFRLPQNGDRISCTLARTGARAMPAQPTIDTKTGLETRETFLAAATKMSTPDDMLTLVDIPGLPELCAKLPREEADRLLERIGAAIKASGAKTSGRLSDTSFGAVAEARKAAAGLASHIRGVLAQDGVSAERIDETLISFQGKGLSSDQRVLAVRYVIKRFASGKHIRNCGGDLVSAFGAMMDETEARLRLLTQTVADGSFSLAYQPIQSLKTDVVSHYEALARFAPGETGETIAFVESLGIAGALDLAVALKALEAVEAEKEKSVAIAFNVSGHTIASPASFGLLAGYLTRKRALAPRVLIEITETAEIADLAAANKAVATLRAMGYRVGLDDFGAGAASLHYLHALNVDFVKFDGSLVKKMGTSQRDDTLLRGLLKLCAELGLQTVAECIETAEQAERARELGFDYAQGFYVGKPVEKIVPALPNVGKRKGAQEEWR